MITHYQADHYFLIFVLYLVLSKTHDLSNIVWLLWRMYLCRHGLYPIHYKNVDIHCHFLLIVTGILCPCIVPSLMPNKVIPNEWICPCTTFSFLYFLPLSLHWIRLLLCLILTQPHFQQVSPTYSFGGDPPEFQSLRAFILSSALHHQLWFFSPDQLKNLHAHPLVHALL